MIQRFITAALLCAGLFSLFACAQRVELPPPAEVSKALKAAVKESSGRRESTKASMGSFYEKRAFEPAWVESGKPSGAAGDLLAALESATAHGLESSRYGLETLRTRLDRMNNAEKLAADEIAGLDAALTLAYLDVAIDLNHGQIDPGSADSRWPTESQETDFAESLAKAIKSGVTDELESLAPPQSQYQRLVEHRQRYADIVARGGWKMIPDGESLEQGQRSPRVATLRKRLQATGDLDAPADEEAANNRFDESVVKALRRFQDRHGLQEDAVLGPATLGALNVAAEQRLRQIDANLERWRWLPDALGDRHIIVNIPEYRVHAYDGDEMALEMKVIVGKTYDDRETPIFTDEMQFVVFRPLWGIPQGIAVEEILPKAREDVSYLASKNYQLAADYSPDAELFPPTPENLDRVEAGELRMRQAGGPQNSLGLVKFLFPNQYAVYLHDTPADHLFAKRERSFSHGCIRLEKPDEMAEFVLAKESGWDISRVRKAMHEGEREQVNLQESIPVYILYWTAFVREDGVMQFRDDIYDQDESLMLAMRQSGA